MRRIDLEHVIRAAGDIADDDELIIIGSQAILGQFPDAPAALLASMEVDLWPKHHPDRADKIDILIGEGSPFHDNHGYYAQGVGPTTAILPRNWESRTIAVRATTAKKDKTRTFTGWCLEAHDLAISKYIAGREKDLEYTRSMVAADLLKQKILLERLKEVELDEQRLQLTRKRIEKHFSDITKPATAPKRRTE